MKIIENHIEIDPPKKTKKLTATRFATIMGLNKWNTPFSAWCEITKVYEDPFVDSIYTVAGKIIEPKVIKYLNDRYFMDIKSPTDVYGADYFRKTWGDFFPGEKVLGGMWDALGDDFVVEIKTTKRSEDWRGADGSVEPPIYYKLQAALYAYLLGFDHVYMTCSFLTDKDYPIDLGDGKFDTTPTEAFEPTIDNTIVIEFSVKKEFPNFQEDYIDPALKFWRDHVETGISPDFDEKKDAKILEVLRKNTIIVQVGEVASLLMEADKLIEYISKAENKLSEKRERLDAIKKALQEYMKPQFRDGDKKVEIQGKKRTWILHRITSNKLDSSALKKELPDVAKKYTKPSISYRLDISDNESNKKG